MAERLTLPPLPIWSERFSREKLLKERAKPVSWRRGFQQLALSDEDRSFPSWADCRVAGLRARDLIARGYPCFTGVDLAGKRRPGTVIVTVAFEPATKRRFLVDVRRGKWSSPETAKQINVVDQALAPKIILVETNGLQEELIDWIQHSEGSKSAFRYWMKLAGFMTGKNKSDPDVGLPSLEVEFHNRAWSIPWDEYREHDAACACAWCSIDKEFADHPFAADTDCVMATWFAREAIEKYGYMAGGRHGGGSIGDLTAR